MAKKRPATIEISGKLQTRGQISGSGSLSLTLGDAASARWTVQKKAGSTLLSLDTRAGLKIRQSKTLKLKGSISKDLEKKTLDGKVGVRLEIPDRASFEISQTVGKGKSPTTRLSVNIRF